MTGTYNGYMQEAAAQAVAHVQGMNAADFIADLRTQQTVLMNIVILGEAAGKVLAEYRDFAAQHIGIPWRGIRCRLLHHRESQRGMETQAPS